MSTSAIPEQHRRTRS